MELLMDGACPTALKSKPCPGHISKEGQETACCWIWIPSLGMFLFSTVLALAIQSWTELIPWPWGAVSL